MAIFENDICPVCQKVFEKGDDIVVCPECGTPHHRECYKQIGKCANSALHSEGFVFKRAAANAEPEKQEEQNASVPPFFASLMADAQKQAGENADTASEDDKAGQSSPFIPPQLKGEPAIKEIDGQPVGYIAATIGANARRFLSAFSKEKTIGWNWSAFIFGPFYYLYRKMFWEGFLLVAVDVAIRMLVSILFSETIQAYSQGYTAAIQSLNDNAITPEAAREFVNQMNVLGTQTGMMKPVLILLGLLFVMHIICALFADSVYKKKVLTIVKEADAKLEQDAFFGVTPFMGQRPDARPEEIKLFYLSSKGGVSLFIPLCAYFVLTIMNMI